MADTKISAFPTTAVNLTGVIMAGVQSGGNVKVPSTLIQPINTNLTSISALGTAADRYLFTNGVNSWAEGTITPYARTLLDDANEATIKATLNIETGVDVQAYSANLTTLSGVTPGAAGLGVLAETASTKGAPINVATSGTVDLTGAVSSQTAVDAAVASANTNGRETYFPAGSYLTTTSIPNLHDVRHRGPGAIKRGSALFYVEPKSGQTNTIYVNPSSGSDSNDGLGSSQALATLERASEVIQNYGSTACKWVVEMAAGTYAGAIFTRDFITGNGAGLLTIQGPTVSVAQNASVAFVMLEQGASGTFQVGETITFSTSGATAAVTAVDGRKIVATITSVAVPVVGQTATGGTSGAVGVTGYQAAVPTAVIDQAQDLGQENGLTLGWLQQIQITNVKTKGFTTAEAAGVNASRFCDIRLTNVHDEGSYYGWSFTNNVTYTASNGLLEDSGHSGIIEYFNIVRSIASTDVLVFNATTNGMYTKELTTGHADSLIVDTAGKTGILALTGGSMNVDGLTLRNCPIGITASHYEFHEETDISWGTGSDACTRAFNFGPHVTRLTTTGWAGDPETYRSHPTPAPWFLDFTTNTYTDAATHTTVLGTLSANEHATKGQSVKVVVKGKRNTGSNGTLTIRLTLATVNVCQAVLPTTATGSAFFQAELEILCYADGDFQRCTAFAIQEGNTVEGLTQDRTETWTANDKILRLEVIQSSAADSVTVNDVRVWA